MLNAKGRLAGKVALITGTGGGMGRTAALRFAAEGARIAGCDLKADGNLETQKLVQATGGEMIVDSVDLGAPDQCQAWVDRAAEHFGRIDILYNNASAARFGAIADMSIEDWRFTLRNELDLVFFATKFAWPYLAASGETKHGGVIINTASVAGLRASSATGLGAHAATKGAVHAFTRQAALEGAPHGIRAVSLSPGFTETPGTAPFIQNPQIRDGLIDAVPLRRICQPEDVVNAALFIASDEAGFITGTDIVVDGGVTAT